MLTDVVLPDPRVDRTVGPLAFSETTMSLLNPRTIRAVAAAASIAALGALTACAQPYPGNNGSYASGPVRQSPILAEYGRVEGIEAVAIRSRPTGAGAILGAVLGGVVGSQFGGGNGRIVGGVAGAVGGGVAGNAIENHNRREDEVFRVTVRFDNGSFRSYDFQQVGDLRNGDRVKFEGGQLYRV